MQDRYWLDLIKRFEGDKRIRFYVVLCDWFTQNCSSEAAAGTFKKYSISASPTIIIAAVRDGKVLYMETLEGVRTAEVLALYVSTALKSLS